MVAKEGHSVASNMKKIVKIKMLPAGVVFDPCGDHAPVSVITEIKSRWPQFFQQDLKGFHLQAQHGDHVITEVIEFLRTTGREPNWNWRPGVPNDHPSLYQIEGERVWEQKDIDNAEFFELHVTKEICDIKLLPPDGIPEIAFSSYRGSPVGIALTMSNPVCSDAFRKELEAQQFRGLVFRQAKIKSRKPEKLVLWQIWSSITLPPVLTPTVGVDGEPFDPAKSLACYVNDIYFPWQHHYSASAFKKIGPFDIAVSTERWGYGYTHHREPAIIVSRRFREWFMTQKVPVEWWPVALE